MDGSQSRCLSEVEHRRAATDDQINVFDYLRVVYRYRRMVMLVCAAGVVLTAIITLRSPRVYSATAKITPPMNVMQDSGLAGGLGVGVGSTLRKVLDTTNISSMYVGILKSRAVADAIIDRFDLVRVYGPKKLRSEVRQTLEENTAIAVSSEGIVNVTVKDRDPNRAAALANAYVEELDQQNKRLSAGQATGKKVFLENRLKEVESRLSKIDNILSQEAKMQEKLFELLTLEYEIAKIEEARSMPTIQVLDKAIPPEVRMPRGTVRKTAMAGVVSLMLGVLLAFGRESFMKAKKGDRVQEEHTAEEQESGAIDGFAEFESHRRIVASQRKKRTQESKPYSRQE